MSFSLVDNLVGNETGQFVANIKVIGVGGGGSNAVEHMISSDTTDVTFIVANTDQQALQRSRANVVIPLGKTGLGAGAHPEVGAQAAEEAEEKIREAIEGAHLLFITAGMGGGTGTGAAPVIARIAKELGILTVAVVTKPFEFEGARRMRQAQAGIENLKDKVDSMIVILNEKLSDELGDDATMLDCFAAADDVLYNACCGIAQIIHEPGYINVDFEDLRTVMSERGTAMMGTAVAEGEDRAAQAAQAAISCPLLEGANLQGARGLLVYITGDPQMRPSEVKKVMSIMKCFVSTDCQLIYGTAFDESMANKMRVTIVATGLDNPLPQKAAPQSDGDDKKPDVWSILQKSAISSPAPAAKPAGEEKPAEKEPETVTANLAGRAELVPPEGAAPAEQRDDGGSIFGVPTFLRNKKS